jgi:hypothetical protein
MQADIFLKHTVLSDRREIRSWPTIIPLLVLDLMATNGGIYEIQALLQHHEAAGRFVTIEEAHITQAQLALSPEDRAGKKGWPRKNGQRRVMRQAGSVRL